MYVVYNMSIRVRKVISNPHQLPSIETVLMAQNKTMALLLATLVAVVAVVRATEEKDIEEAVCSEHCNDEEKEGTIDHKHCVDICILTNRELFGALERGMKPSMEQFSALCNEGCSKEFKEDPATNKKCVDSCIVDAKKLNGHLAKGGASSVPARA